MDEAYRHDNGLSHSERVVRTIKELIRFAIIYILSNPNFSTLGFFLEEEYFSALGRVILLGDLGYASEETSESEG